MNREKNRLHAKNARERKKQQIALIEWNIRSLMQEVLRFTRYFFNEQLGYEGDIFVILESFSSKTD